MLSSSVLRRASIIPVDPAAAPAPHRFSLLRERASDETIFVQEICDAEGRRWSLRVPASGLPKDMVRMLEELEKLAVELGQALPRIVVTCSAESLSLKQIERNAAVCDTGIGRSLAKEKCRVVENEQVAEGPARPSELSSIAVSSPSEQSLTCIYLPEVSLPRLPCSVILICLSRQLANEFLSGSSTSPVLQPAGGFHSKPAQAIRCPRQRAFFSALKEPQPTPGIAKRFVPHLSKTETESGAAASFFSSALPAKSKPRDQATKSKSALPVLKASSKASTTAAATAEDDGRRRARLASISESPRRQDAPAPDAASGAPDHLSQAEASETAMTMRPASAGAGSHHQHEQHPALASSFLSSQAPDRRGPTGADDVLRVIPAPPPTGRKLRHLFRRPPVRSASDPPSYSYSVTDEGVKRPASEVVRAPREVVERRMPRLPSARDLLRKLT